MKFFIRLAVLMTALAACAAQDQTKKPDNAVKTAAVETAHWTTYRLDFKVFELEDGKRINQREFSMIANAAERGSGWSSLRVGTRVPVNSGEKQTYLDVGFNVRSQLVQQEGKVMAEIHLEISSFALPEQSAGSQASTMPVLRNNDINVGTVLTPGKPQIVASVDDVNSKKRTQVELTATRIDQ